ncbi:MAG: hypothetical protein QOG30_1104, partial [Acidimicrobiaceae bacterium]
MFFRASSARCVAAGAGKTAGVAVVGAIVAPNRLRRATGSECAASTDDTRPAGAFDAVKEAAALVRATSGSMARDRATVARRANAAASGSGGTGASASRDDTAGRDGSDTVRFWRATGSASNADTGVEAMDRATDATLGTGPEGTPDATPEGSG